MSNLGKYELEDIVWESSDNDDHIVPYGGDKKIGYPAERDSFNRSRIDLKCDESNANSEILSGKITERKGEASFTTVKEDEKTMLEKSPWTPSSNGGSCLSSNKKSAGSEFCTDDPNLGDQAFDVENNLKQCQLNDASRNEKDITCLGNGVEDKGSGDLISYGWPELENFEDIDNMFRDCDPSFSLDIDNSDDLSWLSSLHTIEGFNDALKSGFDFSGRHSCGLNSVTEQQEVYGQSNNGMSVYESNKKVAPARFERESLKLLPDIRSTVMESYADGSGAIHHVDSQSQILHVSPSRHQKSSQGKRKGRSSENGASFIQFDNLNEVGEANHLLNSQHNFLPENHQLLEINHQPCFQTPKTMINPNNHPSDHVLPSSTPSIIKSEVGVLPTLSPRESSHASNQIKSKESSRDFSFKNLTCSENKKKGKLHQRRLSRRVQKSNLRVQRVDSDMFSAKNLIPNGENETEGQSEVDDCEIGFSGKQDSSIIQEGSCMSYVQEEVAIDASSLNQLQHVMGQLDIRTKLCIRDSLYRLARSAAQRHNWDNQGNDGGDDRDANGALLSGTNKCTGFIDMETDTNPIDRSIAHWLFHRPSDPSASAAPVDAVAVKPHIMVETPNALTAGKPACVEETTMVNEDAGKQRN